MAKCISHSCFCFEYKNRIPVPYTPSDGVVFSSPSFEYELILINFVFGHGLLQHLAYFACHSSSCVSPEGSVCLHWCSEIKQPRQRLQARPCSQLAPHHTSLSGFFLPIRASVLLPIRAVRPRTNGLWGTIPCLQ